MSDISLKLSPLEFAIYAIVIGWPGLLAGGILGGLLWRRRPVIGAIAGAIAGVVILTVWQVWFK
ncbi:MAG: hypothetical protein R3C60_02915 [Parvularculaceae bacterium]